MPAPQTVAEFLELLQKSQLLAAPLYDRLLDQFRELETPVETPTQTAQMLCKSQILTVYQAARLLKGRWEDFYLGRFKVLELLGRGGMGKVYLAEQITMHRLVALKVMRRHLQSDSDQLMRFEREARAVAALNHPNIVRAFDYDQLDGVPYIVMEYVDGLNVEQQVKSFGPVPWRQAADYIRQAALGLQHAHELKLIHRDLKPANLLIGLDGVVKLLDMGLVSSLKDSDRDVLAQEHENLGTVDYSSPEQAIHSHEIDIRADIYSLGAVLHYAITGSVLYPNCSMAQKLLMHQTQPVPPLHERLPDVPPEFSEIVLKMLAKKPEDRYQKPRDVAEALAPFAQTVVPPFPATAVRHRAKDMKPYLRRSPDAAELTPQRAVPVDSLVVRHSTVSFAPKISEELLEEVARTHPDIILPLLEQPLIPEPVAAPRTPVRTGLLMSGMLIIGLTLGIGAVWVMRPPLAAHEVAPSQQDKAPPQDWREYRDELTSSGLLQLVVPLNGDASLSGSMQAACEVVTAGKTEPGRWEGERSLLGGCLRLDQANSSRFRSPQAFSVAIWFATPKFQGAEETLIGQGAHGWRLQNRADRQTLEFNGNEFEVVSSGDPCPRIRSEIPLNDDQWHLAVITQRATEEGVELQLYIDGKLAGIRVTRLAQKTSGEPITIGAAGLDAEGKPLQPFQGRIDEVLFFGEALSAETVARLHELGQPR